MIRLKFVDTYCDSLQEFKAFLASHASDEKNRYHESVAEKFRSGLLEKWLLQEESVQSRYGNEQDASILHSLADAIHQAKITTDSDRVIYTWLIRVFCSQTDTLPSTNPFRFIEIDKLIIEYNRRTNSFSGSIIYEVTDTVKEAFDLTVSFHEKYVNLCNLEYTLPIKLTRISANREKRVRWKDSFNTGTQLKPLSMSELPLVIGGENLIWLQFFLEGYIIPPEKVYIYLETNVPDVYYVANNNSVFISRREADKFLIKTSEIKSQPEDITWIIKKCGFSSMKALHDAALKAGEEAITTALTGKDTTLDAGSILFSFVASSVIQRKMGALDRATREATDRFLYEFNKYKDESLNRYASRHEHFYGFTSFNEQGVARVVDGISDYDRGIFISYGGRIIVPFFNNVRLVGGGLAAISVSSGKTVFVTKEGDEIIRTEEFSDMSVFSEDYLAVRRAATGDWGYLRRDGTIYGSYEKAGDFHRGRAIVFQKSTLGDRWLSIDTDFNEVVLSSPHSDVYPSKSPETLDGMIVENVGDAYGLFTEDGYPVPVMFNLPELGESTLFEL